MMLTTGIFLMMMNDFFCLRKEKNRQEEKRYDLFYQIQEDEPFGDKINL